MSETLLTNPILDRVRGTLIIVLWVGGTVLLWRIAWYWGLVGLLPGLIVAINVVGFAMLPIYWLRNGMKARREERELMTLLARKRVLDGVAAGTPPSDEEGEGIALLVNALYPPTAVESTDSPRGRARRTFGDRMRLDIFKMLMDEVTKAGVPVSAGSGTRPPGSDPSVQT
ncbi:MAG: hypothetical protein JNM10_09835 [Planctomycetia bacterium]|nr:hypothetical protein [Planctomycetia bacterium]